MKTVRSKPRAPIKALSVSDGTGITNGARNPSPYPTSFCNAAMAAS